MSLEENKQIIRRVFEEFTNQQKVDLAEELFSADFLDHGAPPERSGIPGVKESMRLMVVAFPDLHYTIEDIRAEGDRVHVRGTIGGTHLGSYQGGPPTGKRVEWTGMDDFRIENGKIVERWTQRDNISKLRQLGGLKF